MKSLLFVISLFVHLTVYAASVDASWGGQVSVDIPKDGSASIEFTEPVKAISGGRKFRVSAIGADVDEKTRQQSNARVFSVTPLFIDASEVVTFVFPTKEGRPSSLAVKFENKADAATYTLVKLPRQSSDAIYRGFLNVETRMMASMLRDEDAYGRSVVTAPIRFDNVPDLKFEIVRKFEGDGLKGFTLLVTNTSRKRVVIEPSQFVFDKTNPAILAQVDHKILEPCHVNNSSVSTENSCSTAVRIVVKNEGGESLSQFPFTLNAKTGE